MMASSPAIGVKDWQLPVGGCVFPPGFGIPSWEKQQSSEMIIIHQSKARIACSDERLKYFCSRRSFFNQKVCETNIRKNEMILS